MNRITKWVAVAVLVAAGAAFSGTTASAAERGVPVKAAYRAYHRAPAGSGYRWNGWNNWNHRGYYRWHR